MIYCSRGQESILDTFPKPVWSLRACITYIIDTLGLMLNTGSLAITYGNVTTDLFVRLERIRSGDLALTDACQTGIQSQTLGQQNQTLAIIADTLIKVSRLAASHHKVILHTGELAIGHHATESQRFISH